jgi:hypothetical protein
MERRRAAVNDCSSSRLIAAAVDAKSEGDEDAASTELSCDSAIDEDDETDKSDCRSCHMWLTDAEVTSIESG